MLAARKEKDRLKGQTFQQNESLRTFIPNARKSQVNSKAPKINLANVKSDYAQGAMKFKNNQQKIFDQDKEARLTEYKKQQIKQKHQLLAEKAKKGYNVAIISIAPQKMNMFDAQERSPRAISPQTKVNTRNISIDKKKMGAKSRSPRDVIGSAKA